MSGATPSVPPALLLIASRRDAASLGYEPLDVGRLLEQHAPPNLVSDRAADKLQLLRIALGPKP